MVDLYTGIEDLEEDYHYQLSVLDVIVVTINSSLNVANVKDNMEEMMYNVNIRVLMPLDVLMSII